MIRFSNVFFKYPTRNTFAIKNINIHIKKGEFVVLTGSSGCGKTTLLKCLNGMIPNESSGELYGEIIINNLCTKKHDIKDLAQQVGLVFQNPDEQIFSTRVMDEVAFGLENLCFPVEVIKERVVWALEKVGMIDYIDSTTNALSGGQKQRIALASVLALKPEILVLDEPISQLDPKGAKEVLGVIKKLSEEGMTIVLVEHRLHEVISWANRIIVMNDGKIELDKPTFEIENYFDVFEKLGLRKPINTSIDIKNYIKHDEKSFKSKVNIDRHNRDKVIEIRDMFFSYEKKNRKSNMKWIIEGLNLDIHKGEFIGILGNNGSGKSTLMNNIAGIYKPQKGNIFINKKGTKKTSAFELAGTVGILFQNATLMLTCDTVYDEIAFGPKNLKYSKELIDIEVNKYLNNLELNELIDYHPQAVSGGQRLRCAAASIFSMNPDIVLLDEPTSGQDILHINKLMEICKELTNSGVTVIFITHDHEVALKYADRIIYMEDGDVLLDSSTKNSNLENKVYESI